MIGIEIERHFNDDIFFPSMVYDIYLVPLHSQPIKSKTMLDLELKKEDLEKMPPRLRAYTEYKLDVGNKTIYKMYDALNYMKNVDENAIPKEEKKKILRKMKKAIELFEMPFEVYI